MKKGEQTRQRIVADVAPVFNVYGYSGTSVARLTEATGLEKGGIYNHFASKEALAIAAFDYATQVIGEHMTRIGSAPTSATERLLELLAFFAAYVDQPPIAGGCPILNTAIEADDTDSPLRARAQAAMTGLQKLVGSLVKQGVAAGEFRSDVEPRTVAVVVTATLEGAVMLGRLFQDQSQVSPVVAHLTDYLRQLRVDPRT